jgi:putative hydrolase of the HAD superfamily
MPARAVILDFYGTLAETPEWGPSWTDLVAELGYELTPEVRDRWWQDGLDGTEHDEHSQSRDHYVAWQRARLTGMLGDCGVPETEHDDFMARIREVSGHRKITAFAESADVLDELRGRGHTLALCSNWDWDLLEALETAGLDGVLDLTVSSAWVGARKPHPRIYDHTLDALGITATDAIFVGDTWSCDVAGPRAAGMPAVYLRRAHYDTDRTLPDDHEQLGEREGVYRASDLRALLEIVS